MKYHPDIYMAKLSRIQWSLASTVLRRAREAVREAKSLNAQYGIVYNIPAIPNREKLRKMGTEEAIALLSDISSIRSEKDLRVRNRGKGNFLSNYDIVKFDNDFWKNEDRKARLREKLNINTKAGTMGTEADTLTRPSKRLDYNNLPEDFERIRARVERQAHPDYEATMNAQYRENYFTAFSKIYGVDESNYLKERTRALSDEEFFIHSYTETETQLDFIYPTEGEDKNAYLERITHIWDQLLRSSYIKFWQESEVNDGDK